jgi:flagellar biosynthetic protein FliR
MTEIAPLVALADRHLETFLLVFVRMSAMLVIAPVLGHMSIPVAHRAGLGLLLAVVLAPLIGPAATPARDMVALLLAIAGEVVIGLAIGFVALMLVAAIEGAGELVGAQMGLSLASVFDPSTGSHPSIIAQMHRLLAMLLLLALNGHHLVIQAVAASFRRVRPGAVVIGPELPAGIVSLGGTLMRSGLEIAAPLVGLLLVVNIALAFLARVAPQTNVFLLGVPVTIGLGLVVLAETLPPFARHVAVLLARTGSDLELLLIGAAHGAR